MRSAIAYLGAAPDAGPLANDLVDLAEQNAVEILATYGDDQPPPPDNYLPGLCRAIAALRPSYLLLAETPEALAPRGSPAAQGLAIELAHRKASVAFLRNGSHAFPETSGDVARCLRALRTGIKEAGREFGYDRAIDRTPYGYARHPTRHVLIRDPEEQAVISACIQWHKDGLGLTDIVRMLEKEGIPPRGRRWAANTIRRILRRAGCYRRDGNDGGSQTVEKQGSWRSRSASGGDSRRGPANATSGLPGARRAER
ncbi:MAG TPA: recombinase family protein [Phycisphaerae bacterium]|nr:recombinase family protein [Phycisphaerae bacterium]